MNRFARVVFASSLLLSPAAVSAQDALTAVHTAASVAELTPLTAAMAASVRAASVLELPAPEALILPAMSRGSFAGFAAPVAGTGVETKPRTAPWWATTLAIAGPLADGLSTYYAISQSGPHAKVVEGNAFFHKLFGANVSAGEILAFKAGQAALMGLAVHQDWKQEPARALMIAVVQGSVGFVASAMNMRNAAQVQKLNRPGR